RILSVARKAEIHDRDLAYAGRWLYLFRAVDSHGDTVDFYLSETRDRGAAKTFLQKALSNPDHRTPRVLCMDGCRIYPAAIRDLRAEGRLPQRCRRRTKRSANNRIESDHRHVTRRLRAMQRPRTMPTRSEERRVGKEGRAGCGAGE